MGNRSKGSGKGPFKRKPNNYGPPCTNVTYTRDEVIRLDITLMNDEEKQAAIDKLFKSMK